jgi:DNA-binding CsgD family transcriptional regulator
MEKDTVIKALRTPYRRPLEFALTYASLSEREETCLRATLIEHRTEEAAAEHLGYSRDYVTKHKKHALEKLCRAWDYCEIIPILLDY